MEDNNNSAMDIDENTEATNILRQVLGSDTQLTKEQDLVISCLLTKKRNTLYVDRTGAGKSASFFISTKLLRKNPRSGPVFVISPLLALMNDQCENAEKFGLNAVAYNSSTSAVDKDKIIKLIRLNKIDLLYITPEMLSNPQFENRFIQFNDQYAPDEDQQWDNISLLVIDEVHCISDWGHDFRPSYFSGMKTLQQREWFKNALKLATSATVNTRVKEDIQQSLGGTWSYVRGDLLRKNIAIRIVRQADTEAGRKEWLLAFFKKNKDKNVLIFAQFKNDTKAIASQLAHVKAVAYHSEVPPTERKQIETDFKSGKIKVLVSTNAIGMGFDKADIHFVIHTYTPSSPIQYYQEIGRAGRNISIEAKAYLLPKKPYIRDAFYQTALITVCRYLRKAKVALEKEVVAMVETKNIKTSDINTAIDLGIKKGILRRQEERLHLIGEAGDNEDKRYKELRALETSSMDNFRKASSCLWLQILTSLNQEVKADFRCNTCTFCQPKAGDPIFDPVKAEEVCYQTKTPTHSIQVYALGVDDDKVLPSPSKILKILQSYVGNVGEDPPSWCISCVPNSQGNDLNVNTAKDVATELGLGFFSFINPSSCKESMTKANNNAIREQVIEKKFPDNCFLHDQIPKDIKGVILYDDAMKSGKTLDRTAKVLLDAGKQVMAVVTNIWRLQELPPLTTLKLLDS